MNSLFFFSLYIAQIVLDFVQQKVQNDFVAEEAL